MADKRVFHKRSSVTENGKPKLPSGEQLEYGEIVINFADGAESIAIKNSGDDIIPFIPLRAFLEAPVVSSASYLLGIANEDSIMRIPLSAATPADAILYDKQSGLKITASPYGIINGDYPSDRYAPVGVVAIPQSHNVYGTGECGVLSLMEMSCSTPDAGTTTHTAMCWGNADILLGNAYRGLVYVGTCDSPQTEAQGVMLSDMLLPSDLFETTPCPTDPLAFYSSDSSNDHACPSPYLEDQSKNPVYSQTASPSSSSNAFSDFDGRGNTDIIIENVTEDWETGEISNSSTTGNYPAACCCRRYNTESTQQGEWYLPSKGEMGYVLSRARSINDTIDILNQTYGTVGVGISTTTTHYWTSTESTSREAHNVSAISGGVGESYKGDGRYVRAFLRF